MSSVGLIVALAEECRSLTTARVAERECRRLDPARLLVRAGAGPDAARRAAALLADQGASVLVSWGCAAGLDPALRSGDLVLPGSVRQADGQPLEVDGHWHRRLAAGLRPHLNFSCGTLQETVAILATAAEKRDLARQTGAVAADMESAAVARVAAERGLPFLAIRTIVDAAAADVPPSVAAAFDDQGRLRLGRLLGCLLLRPADIPGLIGLGRHFRLAMATLHRVNLLAGADWFGALPDRTRP